MNLNIPRMAKWLLSTQLISLSLDASSSSAFAADSSSRGGLRALSSTSHKPSDHRILQDEEVGILLVRHIQYDRNDGSIGDPEETINIGFENGLIYELTDVDPVWIRDNGNGKRLGSGSALISVGRGATISAGKMKLHGNAPMVIRGNGNGRGNNGNGGGGGNKPDHPFFDRDLEQEEETTIANNLTPEQEGNLNKLRRQLQSVNSNTNGDKTVLAVRVIAGDGPKYGFTEAQLSDSVFGNGNDSVNLRSQYKACS